MKRLAFLILTFAGLLPANNLSAQAVSLDGVDECNAISALLGDAALQTVVPGTLLRTRNGNGEEMAIAHTLIADQGSRGSTWIPSGQGVIRAVPCEILDDRICHYYPGGSGDWCFRVAQCTDGTVDYVGVDEDGSAFGIFSITPDAEIQATSPDIGAAPVLNVPRPAYDTAHIAPAADWQPDPNDAFRGMPGVQGVYMAEGANGPIVTEYLTAHGFSTGRRLDDGRRDTDTLLRIFQAGTDPVTLDGFGSDGDGWYGVLSSWAGEDDRIDLQTATPGVVDFATDATGTASEEHWVSLDMRRFWSYLIWDATTHAAPVDMRVITPRFGEMSTRALLVCDATELAGDVPQTELFGPDETCRRYDRAFEVTGYLSGKNALQVAAALGARDSALVMEVGDIAIAGNTISIVAQPFEPFLLINTGQFMGWDDWIDRTSRAGPSGRRVACTFPMSAAETLATLEVGDLLRFRAELAQASERGVQLNCAPA